jgi:cytochrome o ubiquinol oxidase subunit 3
MTAHAGVHDDHHEETASKVIFGFWVYIMTDFIFFASLFATYVVLHNNTYGGPGIAQITYLPMILVQSLYLLASTLCCGLASSATYHNHRGRALFSLLLAFIFGALFLCLGYHGLAALVQAGVNWKTSAFLSAYFTLIGIHGAHMLVALLWIVVLGVQLLMKNTSETMKIRLTCLSLFVGFVNIVWVAIFSIVYLMGVI